MKTDKNKRGLSLIEMVIVVGIIAMLATMTIGLVSRFDRQAKEKELNSTFALLEGALQEYYEFKGGFPEQSESDFANAAIHSEYLYQELKTIPESRSMLEKIKDSLIENKYGMAESPPEIYDPWGIVLEYIYLPGDSFPKLLSAGPDKIFGTTDDINNR